MDLRVNPWAVRIKTARNRANLTQVELAAQMGVSPRTVQNWETTDRIPQAKHRRLIEKFLNEVAEVAA